MSVVMGLFDYMEKETDYLPWFSVILAFQSIMQSGDIKPEVRVLMQKVATVSSKALELIENQLQANENDKGEEDARKRLVNLIRNINARVPQVS